MNIDSIKEEVIRKIDGINDELVGISHYIFDNPELGFHEFKAVEKLTSKLKENGFEIEKGICDIDTAFTATYGSGKPVIAFMAEFDALPAIGHGCGHNIICTSAIGAAIGLSKVLEDGKGTIKVIGTPAEEGGGGKVLLVERGAFDEVDAAMLMHPSDYSMADDISYACQEIEYTFYGKSAHAAAFPEVGVSALSGVIEFFNSVNALRLHVKDYARIHGIITEGGIAPNIIPEVAKAVFSIRALNSEYLEELIDRVNKCAQGAAVATGTTFEKKKQGMSCKEVKNSKVMVNLVQNNFDKIGEYTIPRTLDQGLGSTDVGNVTHKIPAIQSYIGIGEGLATHTVEFAKAASSKKGDSAIGIAAKVMAMTGVDLFYDKKSLKTAKEQFDI